MTATAAVCDDTADRDDAKRRSRDLYPSRVAGKPEIIGRLDPVVWRADAANAPLSGVDLAAYERDGYLFLDSFLPSDRVASLQADMARLRDDRAVVDRQETIVEPGSREVRSIFDVHLLSQVFSELATDIRLTAIARHILDDDVYLHQTRLNYKPGFRGREFYWHSDFETWHVEDGMPRMRALSMSIALTENTELNGPLMVIPGSHRFYVACVGQTPKDHYKQSLKKQEYGVPDDNSLEFLVAHGGIAAPKGPPGSIVIFDCNTMHGSNGNITPYPRSNAFLVYNAVTNRLMKPFGAVRPRPNFIAHRDDPAPIEDRG